MADQNQRISDLLDTLTDASSEEIETALRIYEPADVAAVVAERALAGGGGSGGSSAPVTEVVDVTVQSPTFEAEHIFTGVGQIVSYKAELTALTPDGETFGTGTGQLGVDETIDYSCDGTNFVSVPDLGAAADQTLDENFFMSTVGQFFHSAFTSSFRSRHWIRVEDTDGVYAGANHPVATVRITLVYYVVA